MNPYFVVFQHQPQPGVVKYGRFEIFYPVISGIDDIGEIESILEQLTGLKDIMVTGWQRFEQMPGSEDC